MRSHINFVENQVGPSILEKCLLTVLNTFIAFCCFFTFVIKIPTSFLGYTNVTDRRQLTDGRTTTYSVRERELTSLIIHTSPSTPHHRSICFQLTYNGRPAGGMSMGKALLLSWKGSIWPRYDLDLCPLSLKTVSFNFYSQHEYLWQVSLKSLH